MSKNMFLTHFSIKNKQ